VRPSLVEALNYLPSSTQIYEALSGLKEANAEIAELQSSDPSAT
jgi:hypothetical protein